MPTGKDTMLNIQKRNIWNENLSNHTDQTVAKCVCMCYCICVLVSFRLLHSDRDKIPDVPAVYFVFPTEENIQRICRVSHNFLQLKVQFKDSCLPFYF